MKKDSKLRYLRFLVVYIATMFVSINKRKILFISMSGNSYGGNPKAFSDFLEEKHNDYIRVWGFSKAITSKVDIYNKCELYSFRYYYLLLTSKYIISDQRLYKPMMPIKRRGQKYIQMWHGTALKKIEGDMPTLTKSYRQSAIRDSKNIDLFISGSDFMSEIYKKSFWYSGAILNCGTPRNDVLFKDNNAIVREKVISSLGIEHGKRIVLYAPTFRQNESMDSYQLDVKGVIKTLGCSYVLVLRLHPNLLSDANRQYIKDMFPTAIDATAYPDMQELLCATDILITDYSSSMFDFMYTFKPCYIFATDIETYDRGFYMSIRDLPFPFAETNAQLNMNIESFDTHLYHQKVREFIYKIGNHETGHACETLFNFIHTSWD